MRPSDTCHIDAARERIQLDNEQDEPQNDAFYVADMAQISNQYALFKQSLPRVEPFYAVKCNHEPNIISTIDKLGINFDCASKGEMEMVLGMGVDSSRIIYANPCKQISHLLFTRESQISLMTFDNEEELIKVKKHYPDAELVLRILADDSRSFIKLGKKFGADLSIVHELLSIAKKLDLNIVGISFHVGSGCFDASAFSDAVLRAKEAFEIGSSLGYTFKLLNIGGGFPAPADTQVTFQQVADAINPILKAHFPSDVRIIAEPGRFFVDSAMSLAVCITAKRSCLDPNDKGKTMFMYHINEGKYSSFNIITIDKLTPKIGIFMHDGKFVYGSKRKEADLYNSKLWGQSMTDHDELGYYLLPELNIGDWLFYENLGSYSASCHTMYTRFKKTDIIYINLL